MNFRNLAALLLPRGRLLALLMATALAAPFAAYGQTPAPAPKATPKATPKAPVKAAPKGPAAQPQPDQAQAPAAQAQPEAGPPVQLIYSPWTKFCAKEQEANAKEICSTSSDGRLESGQPVVGAAIIEITGEPKKVLRVTLPLGMRLPPGTQVVVDEGQGVVQPFLVCMNNGSCISDFEATPELLTAMKKGQTLTVRVYEFSGALVTLPLPLAGEFAFAKAYDGPPTDPKVFQERQKKLQEELQRRAEEQRKKLEAPAPK